jgi:hypothetical protein
LQRHGTDTSPRFGVLDLAPHELAAHIDDTAVTVDVSPLDGHQFGRPKPGRRAEHDHRSCYRPELRGDDVDVVP